MTLLAPSSWTFRTVHSTIAALSVLPLLLTVVTGFGYRFARGVLSYEKVEVVWLMELHTMATLSFHGLYPLLVATAAVLLAATGVPLSTLYKAWQRLRAGRGGVWSAITALPTKYNLRTVHRLSTSLLLVPLSLTAITGAVWTVQQHYLTYTRDDSKWLMRLHQGSYLAAEPRGPLLYTALLALLALPALVSGATMLPLWAGWAGTGGAGGGSGGAGGVQGGGVRSSRGVRYTMLSVKRAFEGAEEEHDEEDTAVGMAEQDEEDGEDGDGHAHGGEEEDEEAASSASPAANSR